MTSAVATLDLPGFSYGGTPVLGPVKLAVQKGEVIALTGPSGIGKSTLLRILAGLTPAPGTRDVTARTAFVFQEPTLLRWRTAQKNIEIAAKVTPDKAAETLADVGLGAFADRYPDQLSLGQQRRLALARAFACDPGLMLLDEPFVSLDAKAASEMMTLFQSLASRRAVATVIVTHAPDEARRLATRTLTLSGTPAQITALTPQPA